MLASSIPGVLGTPDFPSVPFPEDDVEKLVLWKLSLVQTTLRRDQEVEVDQKSDIKYVRKLGGFQV